MRASLILLALLALASCSEPQQERNETVCPLIDQGDSSLNIILAFHALEEYNASYYRNATIAHLASVPPFDSIEPNFYEIPIDNSDCWSRGDKEYVRPQLWCDWPKLDAHIGACDVSRFKLIIVTGAKVQTVAVPQYAENGLAIIHERDFSRYALLHEVGHLFGLQEEVERLRVQESSPARDPRKPNCAPDKQTAEAWWGDMLGVNGTGFYEGCAGNEKYVRPNNVTLMGHGFQDSDYGHVSAAYLRDVLTCCYIGAGASCDGFFDEFTMWEGCIISTE